ncbi:MAG TPA: alpha/beta fold hydrolase [Anaerolineales bacterium]|nr:alpha/beta fold hydrolase [Anaerolineales bacterium]
MAERQIIPSAEPFFFPGGPTGCLLIHGFTGTPLEMRDLGEYLNQQGHTVLGVRLAGHATQINDMIRTRYTDWLVSVEDGYHLLKSHTERIFAIGLSMGGVLAMTEAARLPLAGVVAMSTPYQMPVEWVRKAPWLLPLLSPFSKMQTKSRDRTWYNPAIKGKHISYEQNPTRQAYELYKLLNIMRDSLPNIDVPALVIHSRDDEYVLSENAEPLFDAIGSQEKELVWVDKTCHVVTRDGDVMRVFEPIKAFIAKYSC